MRERVAEKNVERRGLFSYDLGSLVGATMQLNVRMHRFLERRVLESILRNRREISVSRDAMFLKDFDKRDA